MSEKNIRAAAYAVSICHVSGFLMNYIRKMITAAKKTSIPMYLSCTVWRFIMP